MPEQIYQEMELCFLGTGTSQGVPVIACQCPTCKSQNPKDKRLRTSAIIQSPSFSICIDAGPDFRQQMLRENVLSLDAILLTHDHKDHIGGLDDIRAFNWVHQRPMDIYASPQTLNSVKRELPYAFDDFKYPGVPEINLHEIKKEEPFFIHNQQIIPIKAMHLNLPVLGFRIGNISYLTDANHLEAQELEKMRGSKVVVINALRREKHISHFNLKEAIEVLESIKPEKAYLTHMSHQMGLHAHLQQELPDFIQPAYDGLRIRV